ncbi:helix-turn-helix domain-containing protein, partial [Xanthomonas hyacinthi]
MGRQYSHLSSEERAVLQVERDRGTSLRGIGRRLGRSASTLSREIRRLDSGVYSAHAAALVYRSRRSRSVRARRLIAGAVLFEFVHDRLVFDRWSPQQIAATLRDMHPDDASQRVSHETIYAAIYAHPR